MKGNLEKRFIGITDESLTEEGAAEIRRKKADMLKALSIYFKVTFLHQDAAALLEEEDDE